MVVALRLRPVQYRMLQGGLVQLLVGLGHHSVHLGPGDPAHHLGPVPRLDPEGLVDPAPRSARSDLGGLVGLGRLVVVEEGL